MTELEVKRPPQAPSKSAIEEYSGHFVPAWRVAARTNSTRGEKISANRNDSRRDITGRWGNVSAGVADKNMRD